ncbi:hypothetical protein BC830DRAFT_1103006, partial [Chytriomyces sp. MP71]
MGSEQKVGMLLDLDLSSFDSIGLDLDFGGSSFGKLSLGRTAAESVNVGMVSPQFAVPEVADYSASIRHEQSQETCSEAVKSKEVAVVGGVPQMAEPAVEGSPQIGAQATATPQPSDAFDELPVQQHVSAGVSEATSGTGFDPDKFGLVSETNSANSPSSLHLQLAEPISRTAIALEALEAEVAGNLQDPEPFSSIDRPASLASALSSPPLSSPPLPFNGHPNIPHTSPIPTEPLPAPPSILSARSKSNSSSSYGPQIHRRKSIAASLKKIDKATSVPGSAKEVNSAPNASEQLNSFGPSLYRKKSAGDNLRHVQQSAVASDLSFIPITPPVTLPTSHEPSPPTIPVEAPQSTFGGLFRRKSISAASIKQQQNFPPQQHIEMERVPSVASVRSVNESVLSEKSKSTVSASYGPPIHRRKSVSKDIAKAD